MGEGLELVVVELDGRRRGTRSAMAWNFESKRVEIDGRRCGTRWAKVYLSTITTKRDYLVRTVRSTVDLSTITSTRSDTRSILVT